MRDSNLKRLLIKIPGLHRAWIDLRHFGRVTRRAVSSRSKHTDRLHLTKAWDLDTPAVRERNALILDALSSEVNLADCSVLEIGCSEGFFTHQLASRSRQVTALDVSPLACELANRRCAADRNVSVRQFDFECDDLVEKFDVVFAMDVLHFSSGVRRVTAAISKTIDAIASGGLLVFSEHRVPQAQRNAWWQRSMPYGADALLQLFATCPELKLIWSQEHEPADERYTPHLLAIFRKQTI